MSRKIATSARVRSGAARKTPGRKSKKFRKSGAAKELPKKPAENRGLAGVRPPLPGPARRGEKDHLGYLLRQAQAAARLTLERALADLSVTPPQFAVLTLLKAYPGLSGADLARFALLTPQTTGVIIRNLERVRAIRKTPHPVHGRLLQWTLTRRGGTLLDNCGRHVRALERRLASGLTAKAQVTVRRWLSKIAADLQQDGQFRTQRTLPRRLAGR
jgi:DNA-binding MarR family transcriptional regulator